MKTVRELLELAAKAMAKEIDLDRYDEDMGFVILGISRWWNPQTDDGDCARMEAGLRIDIEWRQIGVVACHRAESGHDIVAYEPYADHQDDRQSARRMASLRVAAAIPKAKEAP